jgi:molybdopterin converting factor subunit 1
MMVRVRLFALAREQVGAEWVEVELVNGGTVGELRRELANRLPVLAGAIRISMVAVNAEYAGDEVALNSGDEIALIPPVSGG